LSPISRLVRLLLVHHIDRVAGRTGKHAGAEPVAVARRLDRIPDRLVHRLGEPAELADVQVDPAQLVLLGLLRHEHDFRLDHAGIADHAAARLDDGLRDRVAEMLAQRPEDRTAVVLHRRHVADVLGGKPAAEIDHRQHDAALRAGAEHRRRRLQRQVPGLRAPLLRADMEGHAMRLQAEPVRMLEHVGRHRRIAAELARERPFGAGAVEQDAAEHPRTGRGARDLLHLGLAVDREQPHAERKGAGDIALLLDRVAEGDAIGRRACGERHLDLGNRGGVEAGAEAGEQRQHFRRRIRLDGIEHARVRQRVGEGKVVLAHDVEIDDEARSVVAAIAQKFADALGHGALPNRPMGGARPA